MTKWPLFGSSVGHVTSVGGAVYLAGFSYRLVVVAARTTRAAAAATISLEKIRASQSVKLVHGGLFSWPPLRGGRCLYFCLSLLGAHLVLLLLLLLCFWRQKIPSGGDH